MNLRALAALVALGAAPAMWAGEVRIDLQDSAGKPLQDAVVFAEPIGAAPPAAGGALQAQIDQVNKEFVPRLTIVRAGTSISFPNSDNIRHAIYSFSPAKTFTTKLYAGREAAPMVFDKAGLVVLGCNIHDNMVAWIVVVDTPWFGKSGADGASTLQGLPAGNYKISVWYPSPKYSPDTLELHVDDHGTVSREMKLAVEPF